MESLSLVESLSLLFFLPWYPRVSLLDLLSPPFEAALLLPTPFCDFFESDLETSGSEAVEELLLLLAPLLDPLLPDDILLEVAKNTHFLISNDNEYCKSYF